MNRRAARIIAAALIASACRTFSPAPRVSPYLLDPRIGLPGPFPASIAEGWKAIGERRWDDALRAFSADGDAAAIGRVEVLLETGRISEARASCGRELGRELGTGPLLSACAEVAVREERWEDAFDLVEGAMLRLPDDRGIRERRLALAPRATSALLSRAASALAEHRPREARSAAERALAIAPGNGEAMILAGRAAAAAGDAAAAFAHLWAAWKARPGDAAVGEQAAAIASKLGRDAEALEILSSLARTDPKFRGRAEEAREDFVISNWPAREREIARSARLTRAGALTLIWKLLSPVVPAEGARPVPVASDIVGRKDQLILSRSIQCGLIAVDASTHRARPDAVLTRTEAVRLLLRAAAVIGASRRVECVEKLLATERPAAAAARCGLLPAGANGVSGREFRRSLAFLQPGHPAEKAPR